MDSIQVPKQLQQEGVRFVLVEKQGKKPFQLGWQKKNILHNDPELLQHLVTNGNYGVMGGGSKHLLIIDFDDETVQNEVVPKLPRTFTVKTGRGLLHKYFFSDASESFKLFKEDMSTIADIQGEGKQVIGPSSIHPNGSIYSVVDESDIAFLSYSELKALLLPYDQNPKKPKQALPTLIMEETNDADCFIEVVKSKVSMDDVLSRVGVDTSKNPTNCPFHSSQGGKCMGFNQDTIHCFHCIHPNQDIVTLDGLKPVSNIKVGDVTINANGDRVVIKCITKHKYHGNMLNVFVKGNKSPLQITEGHGMYYIKDVRCNTNYRKNTYCICKPSCANRIKKRCNLWKNKSYDIIGKLPANTLTVNDALFTPLPKKIMDRPILDLRYMSKPNILGPKKKIINEFPLTTESLWVVGMYLAEGNAFRGGIKFSLNRSEEAYADRIISFFKTIGLTGTKFYQETNTGKSLLVHICSTDLSYKFPLLFGKGCQNKKIPRELIDLSNNKCLSLLQGVLDGDGHKTRSGYILGQTSKQLMIDCYELGLKIGYFPSISNYTPLNKRPVYMLYLSNVGNNRVKLNDKILNQIINIESYYYDGDVYDITVDSDHHSLLTPQGIIGNCNNSWNRFTIVMEYFKLSFRQALDWFADTFNLRKEYDDCHKSYLQQLREASKHDLMRVRDEYLAMLSEPKRNWGEMSELLTKAILRTFRVYTTMDDIKSEVWVYHNGIYVPQGRSQIKEFLRKLLGEYYNQFIYSKVMEKIEPDTFINPDEFFRSNNKNEIPVLNGVLNIRTLELSEFTPDKVFFNKLPVTYDPQAKCPKINQFLHEIVGHPGDVNVLYELAGFSLEKDYFLEKAIMCVGFGRNGKSKMLELLKRFVGNFNICSVPLSSLTADSFSVSELFSKLINLAGDISNTDLKDTGMLKSLTGRDIIGAKRKFLRPINFVNFAKIIFACNELPMVYDFSRGFWDRWILLDFPYTFVEESEYEEAKDKSMLKIRNPNIIEEITSDEEMSGLLNQALAGLKRLHDNKGFSYAPNCETVKSQWIRRSNSFIAFCYDRLIGDPDSIITKKELRRMYSAYCHEFSVSSKSDYVIKRVLQDMFGVADERQGVGPDSEYVWSGIKWKNEYTNGTLV
jgi:putative DNA primase/helicase